MDLVKWECLRYLGIPYKWGGNNPIEGFDCSGYAQWILKSCGIDPPGDQTAQALFDHFSKVGLLTNHHKLGTLLFFGQSVSKITHVAICLDAYRFSEAGGGDHLTLTKEDAAKRGACVRIRHINSRKDLVAKIHPNYASIGII